MRLIYLPALCNAQSSPLPPFLGSPDGTLRFFLCVPQKEATSYGETQAGVLLSRAECFRRHTQSSLASPPAPSEDLSMDSRAAVGHSTRSIQDSDKCLGGGQGTASRKFLP